MKNALTKLPPAWHDDARKLLEDNFAQIHDAFVDSTKRAVAIGIFLNQVKYKGKEDGSIPHGEFKAWVAKNCPGISFTQLNVYMGLAKSVCEKGKLEISQKNGNRFFGFSETLALPPSIEKLIEGKTQQQLFMEFKNVDEDGNPRRAGRLPGEGGRKKLSIAEVAALKRENAKKSITKICELIHALGLDWTALADDDLEIFDVYLDRILRAKRLWLKTPLNRRCDIVGDLEKILKP